MRNSYVSSKINNQDIRKSNRFNKSLCIIKSDLHLPTFLRVNFLPRTLIELEAENETWTIFQRYSAYQSINRISIVHHEN
jgi:hypothetical protein